MTHFRATTSRGCSVPWATWRDVGDGAGHGAASLRMLGHGHGHALGWLTTGRGASRGGGGVPGAAARTAQPSTPKG